MEEQFKDIKQLVKEAGTEHPSPVFLQNVMNQIKVSETQRSEVYKPLISKKAWLIIGLVILVFICGVPFFSNTDESIVNTINFSFSDLVTIKNPFSGFTLHKTTVYGVLFLAMLFFVQITILKRRIDKSFSL